jgi:hypothetical protein
MTQTMIICLYDLFESCQQLRLERIVQNEREETRQEPVLV